jgi:FkbM family methyltransferase
VTVDVGANYGEFTAAASGRSRHIIAVEPNPLLSECLTRTFEQSKNVVVERCALGGTRGAAIFYFNRTRSGRGSLKEKVAELVYPSEQTPYVSHRIESVRVTLTTLAALIQQHAGAVNSLVLKLDVEGHEPSVLRVSLDYLAGLRWWRGLVEFNAVALRRSGEDPGQVWEFLKTFDYVSVGDADRVPSSPPEMCNLAIGAGTPSPRTAAATQVTFAD